MKKLLSVVAACLLTASAFAGGKYMGDIQVHAGYGIEDVDAKNISGIGSAGLEAPMFVVEVESWNLFKINDLLSVGAAVEFGMGFGGVSRMTVNGASAPSSYYDDIDSKRMEIIFGPAVAFDVNDFLRIQATVGFIIALRNGITLEDGSLFKGKLPKGVSTEVQVKFFPTKRFSPIAGYKLAIAFFDEITDGDGSNSAPCKGTYIGQTMYIGGSFNW